MRWSDEMGDEDLKIFGLPWSPHDTYKAVNSFIVMLSVVWNSIGAMFRNIRTKEINRRRGNEEPFRRPAASQTTTVAWEASWSTVEFCIYGIRIRSCRREDKR